MSLAPQEAPRSRSPEPTPQPLRLAGETPTAVERFNIHQRLQHLLLVVSITILVITGFTIKYGNTFWAPYVVKLFGGFRLMFNVHLAAAIVMSISGIYHISYLLANIRKYPLKTWAMLPGKKDLADAMQHLRYLAGLSHTPPSFDRYSYLEKFEYFASFWGFPIMILTGLALWFPARAASVMPRWVLDIFRVAHSNEALVAFLAIAAGHIYAVHLKADTFPQNQVWITGKMSLHHLAEEHPLEFQRLARKYEEEGIPLDLEEIPHPRSFSQSRRLLALEMAFYGTLFVVLLGTFLYLLFT